MSPAQAEDRQALAEAATAAGVPLEAVERAAADYRARLSVEQSCGSLPAAVAKLQRIAWLARELLRELYLLPSVQLASGLDQVWPWAAPRGVQYLNTLASLAETGIHLLAERSAGCARGGRGRGLAALIAPEPAKQRLARDLAALLPGRATVTDGGPLFTLTAAVHHFVTGEGERGIENALKKSRRKPHQ